MLRKGLIILLAVLLAWAAINEAYAQRFQRLRDRQPGWRPQQSQRLERLDRLIAWRDGLDARRRAAIGRRLERLRNGALVLNRQILAIDPSPEALARAQALGFRVIRAREFGAVGLRLVVLRAPADLPAQEALAALQGADPLGSYELNHVFDPSWGDKAGEGPHGSIQAADGRGLRIGMIDTGVDASHPALRKADLHLQAFGDDKLDPAPHGTAVASLLVGEDADFRGGAIGASLYGADVFGQSDTGGSAEEIVAALSWMAAQDVRVINISLTGPQNRLLAAAVRRLAQQGRILVGAAGNDGPAAPVAFPAAYEGMIAATAVDSEGRIYVAANRGPQVRFAALGVAVRAATMGKGYASVSGTSFAAPQVALALARTQARAEASGDASPEACIAILAAKAEDLGAPGRDEVFGYGRV